MLDWLMGCLDSYLKVPESSKPVKISLLETGRKENVIFSSPNKWLSCTKIVKYLKSIIPVKKSIKLLDPGYFVEGKATEAFTTKIQSTHPKELKYIDSFRQATHILLPLSQKHHWYLMLITINKRAKKITLRCLDGFNSTSAHSDLFLEVERIFKEIFKKQKPPYKFEHKSLEIRSQNNGDDCGVVVCNYAELFLKYKGNVVKFEKHLKEKGSEARDYTKYRTSRNLHIRSKIRLD